MSACWLNETYWPATRVSNARRPCRNQRDCRCGIGYVHRLIFDQPALRSNELDRRAAAIDSGRSSRDAALTEAVADAFASINPFAITAAIA